MTPTIDLPQDERRPDAERRHAQGEQERLIVAVKAGDKEAWHRLLRMTPPVSPIDPETGELATPISDESLRRENMYEDRA